MRHAAGKLRFLICQTNGGQQRILARIARTGRAIPSGDQVYLKVGKSMANSMDSAGVVAEHLS